MPSPEDVQVRADSAAALLENRVMRSARQAVRDKVYNTWVQTTDPAQREKLHSIAAANEELWSVLHGYVTTGDVDLTNIQKRKLSPP